MPIDRALAAPDGPDKFIMRESGGQPFIGTGGHDLSNAPLDKHGFPVWSGIPVVLPDGTPSKSHAAGLYQIQPGLWAKYAKPGETFHSAADQKAVAHRIWAAEGDAPWRASAPGGGGTGGVVGAGARKGVVGALGGSNDETPDVRTRRRLTSAFGPEGTEAQTVPAAPAPIAQPVPAAQPHLSPIPLPAAPNLGQVYRDALSAILSGRRRSVAGIFG